MQREQCFSVQPFLAFLGLRESLDSTFLLESAPFALSLLGGLALSLRLLLMFSRTNNKALVLTGVEFSMRSYCRCNLTGLICNRCVARSAFSSGVTGLVAKLAFRLWNKLRKFSRELFSCSTCTKSCQIGTCLASLVC